MNQLTSPEPGPTESIPDLLGIDNTHNKDPFESYRNELRALLANSEQGYLLDANQWWNQFRKDSPATGRVVFRLATSERHQQKFLSLWKLFDEAEQFEDCLSHLVEQAKWIRDRNPYSTIVTCTATAKHLLEQIHQRIDTNADPVRVQYLSSHPFVGNNGRSILDFKGQRVLILADVVASGSLVRRLSEAVTELGGEVVAALCVAIVGVDLVREQRKTNEPPLVSLGPTASHPIRLFNLTDLEIPDVTPSETDQVIQIGDYTVYPEELHRPNQGPTAYSTSEAFRHFEESQSIAFDFFEWDGSLYTTAVRLHRLFNHFGDAIWSKIKPWLQTFDKSAPLKIVTTFNGADLEFQRFVMRQLALEGKAKPDVTRLHRREVVQDGASFVSLPVGGESKIAEKSVVLLLSSVHSSQSLREFASFLATSKVTRIDVVCLINRMGRGTSDFITRIQTLLRGLGASQTGPATFEFHAVYAIQDFETHELLEISETVETLFNHYARRTKVPSFHDCLRRFRKYFEPRSVTGFGFQNDLPTPIEPFVIESTDIATRSDLTVRTQEGRLGALVDYVQSARDFSPVIRAIGLSRDRRELLKLFAILLRDVSRLRWKQQSLTLRNTLLGRIRDLRRERFDAETQGDIQKVDIEALIDRNIDLETHLAFGLALFSYLDGDHDDQISVVLELLDANLAPGVWISQAENFLQHFGDDRIPWTVSLITHLSFQQPGTREKIDSIRKQIRERIQLLLDHAADNDARFAFVRQLTVNEQERDRVSARLRHVEDNLQLLLEDLGDEDLRRRDEVVRTLQKHFFESDRHSPIISNLRRVEVMLGEVLKSEPNTDEVSTTDVDSSQILTDAALRYRRVGFGSTAKTREMQTVLEDAIHTLGMLKGLAATIVQFFQFTRVPRDEMSYYVADSRSSGFAKELSDLSDLLQLIRYHNAVSLADLEQIVAIKGRFIPRLWSDSYPLRTSLIRYCVKLRESWYYGMQDAQRSFVDRNRWYQTLWKNEIDKHAVDQNSMAFPLVIIDPFLIQETLRNIATNARHAARSFRGRNERKDIAGKVSSQIELVQDNMGRSCLRLIVDTLGKDDFTENRIRYSGQDPQDDHLRMNRPWDKSTFEQHRLDIEKWGGKLTIERISDVAPHKGKGTRVTLILGLLESKLPQKQ